MYHDWSIILNNCFLTNVTMQLIAILYPTTYDSKQSWVVKWPLRNNLIIKHPFDKRLEQVNDTKHGRINKKETKYVHMYMLNMT